MNGLAVINSALGVMDHCQIVMGGKTNGFVDFYGGYWNGANGDGGDKSWADSAHWGSNQFFFVEDCTTTNLSSTSVNGLTDGFAGARFVIRHNAIGDQTIHNHGTESPRRSARAMEVYNNTFTGSNRTRFVGDVRGGGAVVHDNTITGFQGVTCIFSLATFRELSTTVAFFGGADGTNVWDKNYPVPPNNGPFTVTAVNGQTVTVANVNWATNQWRHYSLKRDNNPGGFGLITANTSNTITWASGFQQFLVMNVGDVFSIFRVNAALDQPGLGAGSPLVDPTPSPPAGWNDQVVEPCYSWNNTSDGAPINLFPSDNQFSIREGEHFFNSPMPGYTPYTYPHPLTVD